jgi:hypothetical protein
LCNYRLQELFPSFGKTKPIFFNEHNGLCANGLCVTRIPWFAPVSHASGADIVRKSLGRPEVATIQSKGGHRTSDAIGTLAAVLAKAQAELTNPEKSLVATEGIQNGEGRIEKRPSIPAEVRPLQ